MWDANKNLMPTDMTQAAVQARMIQSYAAFDGIYFPATICIKAGNNGYAPKNELYNIITPDKAEYAKLMNGEDVEPLSIGIVGEGKGKAAKTENPKPAWATSAPAPQPTPAQESWPGIPSAPAAAPSATQRPDWAR